MLLTLNVAFNTIFLLCNNNQMNVAIDLFWVFLHRNRIKINKAISVTLLIKVKKKNNKVNKTK